MRKNEQLRSRRRAARIHAYRQRRKRAEDMLEVNILRVRNELGQGRHIRWAQAKRLADRLKLPEAIQRSLGLRDNHPERSSHLLSPLLLMPSPPMPSFTHLEPLLDRLLLPAAPLIFPIHLSDDRPFKNVQ